MTRSVLRDEHEAEDAVQDTFLRALRSVRSLREPKAFPAWLLRVARNAALDRCRKLQRTPQVSEDVERVPDQREALPGAAVEVAEAFSRLAPSLQRALNLHLSGVTIAQAARRDGISLRAARTRLWRARDRIRQMVLS